MGAATDIDIEGEGEHSWFWYHYIGPHVRNEILSEVAAVLARNSARSSSDSIAGHSAAISHALQGVAMLHAANATADRGAQRELTQGASKAFATAGRGLSIAR